MKQNLDLIKINKIIFKNLLFLINMLHAKKLLYIGSGLHIKPVKDFLQTKKFIFIDTLPRSEFSENNNISYNKYFYNNLIDKCKNYKFKLNDETKLNNKYINSSLLIFNNNETNQTIKYYISTNFLYVENNNLINDIIDSDGLIVSSYYPNKRLLKYFTFPKKLFCYNDNIYNYTKDHWLNDEYESSIFSILDTDKENIYVNEFNLIYENGNIMKFNSIDELKIVNNKKNN